MTPRSEFGGPGKFLRNPPDVISIVSSRPLTGSTKKGMWMWVHHFYKEKIINYFFISFIISLTLLGEVTEMLVTRKVLLMRGSFRNTVENCLLIAVTRHFCYIHAFWFGHQIYNTSKTPFMENVTRYNLIYSDMLFEKMKNKWEINWFWTEKRKFLLLRDSHVILFNLIGKYLFAKEFENVSTFVGFYGSKIWPPFSNFL